MVDSAAGQALLTTLRPEFTLATSQMETRYLRSFREGTAIARGEVIKHGKRVCYVEVTIRANDERLIRGSAVMNIRPKADSWTRIDD